MQRLREYFTAGKVIYSSYWRSYDKVISFNIPKKGDPCEYSSWSVTVIPCDKEGNILAGAVSRTHCTNPFLK